MSIYVDNMRAPFGRLILCHMIADTEAELHDMADKINVARKWYQGDHYDIALSKRAIAVSFGAIEVNRIQCGFMALLKRMGKPMGAPETGKDRYIALMQQRRRAVA